MSRPPPLTIRRKSPPPATPQHWEATGPEPREILPDHLRRSPSPPSAQFRASSPGPSGIEDHCTCPPEHKIPRPENCFILFRSAHQKQLSATGGNNQPGISVKLGDLWKNLSPADKEYWKAEAEKKKALHRQRYPNYKYQPKSKHRSNSSATDQNCNICGKRLLGIQPLNSPTRTASSSQASPTFSQASSTQPEFRRSFDSELHRSPTMAQHKDMTPQPRGNDALSQMHKSGGSIRKKRNPESEYVSRSPETSKYDPDPKRRRLSQVNIPHTPAHAGASPQTARLAPYNPSHYAQSPALSTTRPPPTLGHDFQAPLTSKTAMNTPERRYKGQSSDTARTLLPPTPTPIYETPTPRTPHIPQQLPAIAGLIHSPLPPRTSMPPPMRRSVSGDRERIRLAPLQGASLSDTRADETIATNLHFADKISRLSKVSPPLKSTLLSAAPHQVRGILVSIEGDDPDAAQSLAKLLAASLHKEEGQFDTKLDLGPTDPNAQKEELSLRDYLSIISQWHERNADMVRYLTNGEHNDSTKDNTAALAVPVLIIPNYQVLTTDLYAARIPITDGFSPDHHYQHMVNLWRGIVGPDLTIYLRDVDKEQLKLEYVHMLHQSKNTMRIAKEKGSSKVDEERIRSMRYQVGAFIRRMAGPLREIDLGQGGQ